MPIDRRTFLTSAALAAAGMTLPPAIARALDIPAQRKTGTIRDVEHVVILTQENRSFDHYFGTMRGVRGFSDRFAAPAGDGTVFVQPDEHDDKKHIAPFRFNTTEDFHRMRATGTPHTWSDAHAAWDHGRMANWPGAKHNHAMGHFTREDIPFQYALAEAFTICDAYHCGIHAGTDPNRLYIWTGMVDADGKNNGPVIYNAYDTLSGDEHGHGGYTWTTYPERLTAAGITWQVYQNTKDNFDDNPLVGFKLYRVADKADQGPLLDLAQRSLRTRDLDLLKADVLADKLPQVSWVVAPAAYSEHPGPSSPAEGADYTSRVLDALTANPDVWAKTVFLVNFDENDGYFDHVPTPSAPSVIDGKTWGSSQVDTTGEYISDKGKSAPAGPGPRVPLYVVSPWSKGGFVNSQVFDHTSVIRFLETRFGVHEPNISAFRRAVCGDLTSCFDFSVKDGANPDDVAFFAALPATADAASRAKGYILTTTPDAPDTLAMPVQETGQRPARPLPYVLEGNIVHDGKPFFNIELVNNSPDVAVVFHVYGMQPYPSRYTVAAGNRMMVGGISKAQVIGPSGFTRALNVKSPLKVDVHMAGNVLTLVNNESAPLEVMWSDLSYGAAAQRLNLQPGERRDVTLDLSASHGWYDFNLSHDTFSHRFAGHIENGQASMSDPALGGPAPTRAAWTA